MTMDDIRRDFAAGRVPYRPVPDDEIDCSDIPEIADEQWKNFRPLWVNGRRIDLRPPATVEVPVRLERGLVAGLKREAKKKRTTYELLIRRILEDHLAHAR